MSLFESKYFFVLVVMSLQILIVKFIYIDQFLKNPKQTLQINKTKTVVMDMNNVSQTNKLTEPKQPQQINQNKAEQKDINRVQTNESNQPKKDSLTKKVIDIDNGNPDRKYVYFDLGTNNGDSLKNFFGIDRKIHPEWKLNIELNSKRINSVNWIAYAFEANPKFNEQLWELKKRIPSRNTVHIKNGTAAWIKNGQIDFYLDLINAGANFWGSSLKETHRMWLRVAR